MELAEVAHVDALPMHLQRENLSIQVYACIVSPEEAKQGTMTRSDDEAEGKMNKTVSSDRCGKDGILWTGLQRESCDEAICKGRYDLCGQPFGS